MKSPFLGRSFFKSPDMHPSIILWFLMENLDGRDLQLLHPYHSPTPANQVRLREPLNTLLSDKNEDLLFSLGQMP